MFFEPFKINVNTGSALMRKILLNMLMLTCVLWLVSIRVVFAQTDAYTAEIEQWHQSRIDRLKQPNGWLSLAGLFWLKEGENTFGSDAGNDIMFPAGASPFIGSFRMEKGIVSVIMKADVQVLHENALVSEMTLSSDKNGDPTKLRHGSLLWYIIDRDGKMAVRLKDAESKALADFHGINMFPVDPAWRTKAKLDTLNAPRELKVPSVLGTATVEHCPGALVFKVNGAEHRLYPTGKVGDDRYFLIFADETNGNQTYGAGRFLYIDGINENGETVIDFNKAYNPPCAFTPFATCPLPPRENRLLFSVTAGEKSYAKGH